MPSASRRFHEVQPPSISVAAARDADSRLPTQRLEPTQRLSGVGGNYSLYLAHRLTLVDPWHIRRLKVDTKSTITAKSLVTFTRYQPKG